MTLPMPRPRRRYHRPSLSSPSLAPSRVLQALAFLEPGPVLFRVRSVPPAMVATAIIAGVLGGTGIGLLGAMGEVIAASFAVAGGLLLAAILGAFTPYRPLAVLVALAYSGRLALLAVLHYYLVAIGRGGYLFGDDFTVGDLAGRLAQYLHGEPATIAWIGEGYLLGGFVNYVTAIFYVFGPQVTIVKVLNAVLASMVCVLVYLTTRRLFSGVAASVAAGLVAFFPSLVLWSTLNLKDTIVQFLVAGVIWSMTWSQGSARRYAVGLPAVLLLLAILEEMRWQAFVLLAWVVPLATVVGPGVRRFPRLSYGLATTLVSGALLAYTGYGFLGVNRAVQATDPEFLEAQRSYQAGYARTAFTDRPAYVQPAVQVKPGDTLIIVTQAPTAAQVADTAPPPTTHPASAPSATAESATLAPTSSPDVVASARVVEVVPGTTIALAPTPTASPSVSSLLSSSTPGPDVVLVRPGDVVVISGARTAPNAAPTTLALPVVGSGTVELRTDTLADAPVFVQALAYLPKGMIYALAAPFPWTAQTITELLTIPEMLLWYVLVVLAILVGWQARRRWRALASLVGYLVGTFLVLALVEGNVGTLFRHRAMLLPFVFMLAAPGVVALVDQLRARWARANGVSA